MSCGAVVCSACTTRIRGVNHCPSCVASLSRAAAEGDRGEVRRIALAAALFFVIALEVYVTLYTLLLW